MKVVFISRYPKTPDQPKGGVESVTTILAEALANHGVDELHVLTLRHDLKKDIIETFGKVTVHRLAVKKCPQIIDIFIGPGAKRIKQKIADIRPDIVHSHETHGLALYNLGIPHIMTVHGFDHANVIAEKRRLATPRAKLWGMVEKFTLNKQSHIISISPYVSETIRHLCGPAIEQASITEIDNPVEEAMFQLQRSPGYPPNVLCVGWINERKNTLGAIKAFAPVLETVPEARLRIAGMPQLQSYYQQVEALIKQLGIESSVDFLGHINRQALQKELEQTAVLLLPSLQENAPMAISEAQAVGVPVVTSNRCGMKYMIKPNETGYLIEPENTSEISEKLLSFLSDRSLNMAFSKKAKEHASGAYFPARVAEKTCEIYRKLAS